MQFLQRTNVTINTALENDIFLKYIKEGRYEYSFGYYFFPNGAAVPATAIKGLK